MAGVLDTIRANRETAMRIAEKVGAVKTRGMLQDAERELVGRLANLSGTGTFTEARLRTTLVQIREVLRGTILPGMQGIAIQGAEQAAGVAATGTIDYLNAAERAYKGIGVQELAIDEASVMDAAVVGARASVLRRLSSPGPPAEGADAEPHPARVGILRRYGMNVIGHFEKVLRTNILARTSFEDTRQQIINASPFLQQAPAYWSERIVRTECLVGETLISGAVVRAVFRRWYEGDVVEIVTKRGRKFTTTPNHPMLTTRTWVHAEMLRPGDDLVCYRGKQDSHSAGDEDVTTRPTTIREVFDSLATVGIRERRPTTQVDFHGDGMDGDVDVFRPNGALRIGSFAPIYKPLAQELFTPTDMVRSSFCTTCRRLLSIQKQACHCRRTRCDSGLVKSVNDGVLVATKFLGECLGTLARLVAIDDFLGGQLCPVSGMSNRLEAIRSSGRSISNDANLVHEASDGTRGDPQLNGDGIGAQSGEVELDSVVSAQRRSFTGHVFNLETPYGYYAINGAYTGNTMGAYNKANFEATKAADEQLGDLVKILCATFDNRTASDSYACHGEIRRPDEAFETWFGLMQHPPNRPNDREIVITHRKSWPIPKALTWRSEGEIASAWKREKRKGAMPPRPLMTTVPIGEFGRGDE